MSVIKSLAENPYSIKVEMSMASSSNGDSLNCSILTKAVSRDMQVLLVQLALQGKLDAEFAPRGTNKFFNTKTALTDRKLTIFHCKFIFFGG